MSHLLIGTRLSPRARRRSDGPAMSDVFVQTLFNHATTNQIVWRLLTLALVVDAALRFRLELGPNVVEQLVQALGWANLGTTQDAGRRVAVIHGRDDLAH